MKRYYFFLLFISLSLKIFGQYDDVARRPREMMEGAFTSFGNGVKTVLDDPDLYTPDGYPYLATSFGLSKLYGEYVRLKASLGKYAGYTLYGGIGKDWLFNGDNKDKLSWHVGLGYYLVPDDGHEVTLGIAYSETSVVEGGALSFDIGYSYFFPFTNERVGVFAGTGIGIGNLKEALNSKEGEEFKGKFIWDISIGISIKLFAGNN